MKKDSGNNLWVILLFFVPLFMDTNHLINVPNFVYNLCFFISFILPILFCVKYLKGTNWYMEIKSIFYVIVGVALIGLPLGFAILSLFKFTVINIDYANEKILFKKSLVTNVSSGKYSSLSYEFNDKIFQTKSFYYQDYRDCNRNCYINLTLKTKPWGMFYVTDVEKIDSPVFYD